MKYNPTEALKLLSGITRKRLYEMMSNGELSYDTKNNKRLIDGSELARAFGNKFKPDRNKKTFQNTEKKQNDTLETQKIQLENARISAELDAAKRIIEELKTDKEDYKIRLDKAQSTIERQTYLISDMREKSQISVSGSNKKFLGIFPRKTG